MTRVTRSSPVGMIGQAGVYANGMGPQFGYGGLSGYGMPMGGAPHLNYRTRWQSRDPSDIRFDSTLNRMFGDTSDRNAPDPSSFMYRDDPDRYWSDMRDYRDRIARDLRRGRGGAVTDDNGNIVAGQGRRMNHEDANLMADRMVNQDTNGEFGRWGNNTFDTDQRMGGGSIMGGIMTGMGMGGDAGMGYGMGGMGYPGMGMGGFGMGGMGYPGMGMGGFGMGGMGYPGMGMGGFGMGGMGYPGMGMGGFGMGGMGYPGMGMGGFGMGGMGYPGMGMGGFGMGGMGYPGMGMGGFGMGGMGYPGMGMGGFGMGGMGYPGMGGFGMGMGMSPMASCATLLTTAIIGTAALAMLTRSRRARVRTYQTTGISGIHHYNNRQEVATDTSMESCASSTPSAPQPEAGSGAPPSYQDSEGLPESPVNMIDKPPLPEEDGIEPPPAYSETAPVNSQHGEPPPAYTDNQSNPMETGFEPGSNAPYIPPRSPDDPLIDLETNPPSTSENRTSADEEESESNDTSTGGTL